QAVASERSILRAPDKDELEMVQRTGRASRKMVLQEKVNSALLKSRTLKSFVNHLEQAGVQVLFNQASTGRVSGITYFMDDFMAKGQALGSRFKWANIINTIDYEQTRDSPEISQADRKSTRLNSSHVKISYAVFCLKKKTQTNEEIAVNAD